jgi:circadian clock protein KaiC
LQFREWEKSVSTQDKVKINKLPTGVPGLDEIVGGGLPEFSFNIVAGAPGSGKTTGHARPFGLGMDARKIASGGNWW